MEKFQISVIDFIPESGKHPINEKDSNGDPIFYGDIVNNGKSKYMIAYRYGATVLKPAMSACYIGITDYSTVTKLNEMWSTPDFLACGMKDEEFYQKVKHLES